MFKKPSDVRGHQRLSGADRKKIKRNIKENFSLLDEELESLLSNKVDLTVTKLASKAVLYTVEGGLPLFFDVDGRGKDILPTVFSLWKFPSLVPSLELKGSEVSTFVLNGADVMLPGVNASTLPEFPEGAVLSVKVPGNAAPIAIGIAAMSSDKAKKSGFRGRGLRLMHHYLDNLWETADGRFIPNAGFKDGIVEEDPTQREAADACQEPEALSSLIGDEREAQHGQEASASAVENATEGIQSLGIENEADSSSDHPPAAAEVAMSVEDMDALLDRCFLQALWVSVKDKDLPEIGSHFWANHMLPSRPAGSVLDFKKSSFKKLSKFLLTKAQESLISAKEEKHSKEIVLTAVNRQHPAYTSFHPHPKHSMAAQTPPPDSSEEQAEPPLPAVEALELYKVSAQMGPVFDSLGMDRGRLYLASEVTEAVLKYVEVQALTSARHGGIVVLNAELCDALFKGAVKKGSQYPTEVHKRDLPALAAGRMQACHRVTRGEKEEVRKGVLPKVQLLAERRASNKKVTRVTGLEGFLLEAEAVAGELQKKFACSVSVGDVPGRKGASEVLVQGRALEELGRHFCQHYGIPKKHIEVLDKTKK